MHHSTIPDGGDIMTKKKRTEGILCALCGGLLWGCSGTVSQYLFLTYDVDASWLTTMRMLIAGCILILIALFRRVKILDVWKTRRSAIMLVIFAIAGLMAVQITYLKGISFSNSATTTALQYTGQALILAVTCIMVRRWPTSREWIALALAILGIFLLCTHGDVRALSLNPKAVAWSLSSAVALMLYTLLPKNLIETYGGTPVIGTGMLMGGIVLLCITRAWRLFPTLDAVGWIFVVFVGAIGTALAFSLFLHGVTILGGVMAGLLTCVEPVAAALLTRFWLKTELVAWDYVAFVLIIGMSLLISWPTKGSKKVEIEEPVEG